MNFLRGYLRFARFLTLTHIAGIFKIYARKSGGSFFELNLGVLRILLFPGRAESPMERLAQGKRSGTLGWIIVSKTIYALKGRVFKIGIKNETKKCWLFVALKAIKEYDLKV